MRRLPADRTLDYLLYSPYYWMINYQVVSDSFVSTNKGNANTQWHGDVTKRMSLHQLSHVKGCVYIMCVYRTSWPRQMAELTPAHSWYLSDATQMCHGTHGESNGGSGEITFRRDRHGVLAWYDRAYQYLLFVMYDNMKVIIWLRLFFFIFFYYYWGIQVW